MKQIPIARTVDKEHSKMGVGVGVLGFDMIWIVSKSVTVDEYKKASSKAGNNTTP